MADLLLDKGRTAIAVKPHLRAFLRAQGNVNKYLNELIQLDAQKRPEDFIKAQKPKNSQAYQ